MGWKGFGDSVVSRTWCLGGGTLALAFRGASMQLGRNEMRISPSM